MGRPFTGPTGAGSRSARPLRPPTHGPLPPEEHGWQFPLWHGPEVVGFVPLDRTNHKVEPEQLKSALTHLTQNAIEASAPGDCVVIATRRRGAHFVIEVTDQGQGMDEAFIRDELFLPFRSTKSSGYGIGAFQTRELIRAAGGDLEVISEIGAGTTMRIIFPVSLEMAAPPALT
jgi:signal transduction histidine kinase